MASETKQAEARRVKEMLANDEIPCDCPRAELEIGGHGHYADCDTAIARAIVRAAAVLR